MLLQCLSIRQPWASLVISGVKTVENRFWRTPVRGTIAVHASACALQENYQEAQRFIAERGIDIDLPAIDELPAGVILGLVDIKDCVEESSDPWFTGPYGYVLFRPRRGPIKPQKEEDKRFFPVSYPHFGNCACGGAILRPGLDGYECEFCGSNRACIKCGKRLARDEFLCAGCNREMSKDLSSTLPRRKR